MNPPALRPPQLAAAPPERGWSYCSRSRDGRASQTTLGKRLLRTTGSSVRPAARWLLLRLRLRACLSVPATSSGRCEVANFGVRRRLSRKSVLSGGFKWRGSCWRRSRRWISTRSTSLMAYGQYRARDPMRNGRRLGAHSPPKPYIPPAAPEGRINTTDPDSHVVKGLRGHMQGYNAQAVPTSSRSSSPPRNHRAPDFGLLEPMLAATRRELQPPGSHDAAGVLADAGYWHSADGARPSTSGIQVLIPPDTSKRNARAAAGTGGYYAFMRRVLATSRRRALPTKPADDRARLRPDQVQPRDRPVPKTRPSRRPAEWRLITATHNLLKLHRHSLAAAPKRQQAGSHRRRAGRNATPPPPLDNVRHRRRLTRQPRRFAAVVSSAAAAKQVHDPRPELGLSREPGDSARASTPSADPARNSIVPRLLSA